MSSAIQVYTQAALAERWLQASWAKPSVFACVLGFTETGLIPGISAAGASPADREFTAIADAEFLYCGPQVAPRFPLPPLVAGVSPTLISRAVIAGLGLPLYLLDAGLRHPPTVPAIALQGSPAQCVRTGAALPLSLVEHLFQQGRHWGAKLASQVPEGYLILGECVVGGTTTALAILTALGWDVAGKVNSSHAICNHQQKWEIVQHGLTQAGLQTLDPRHPPSPFQVVAAVGDPMQPVVAGMAIAASRCSRVLLAGGTQMLAVYALIRAIAQQQHLEWNPAAVVVGTTRWVAEDPTGDTVGLAAMLEAPLLATTLDFTKARFAALRAYERGFVKEGVGAGGCAIAAHLQGWDAAHLRRQVEALLEERQRLEATGVR